MCVRIEKLPQERKNYEPRINGRVNHSFGSHHHQEDINSYQKLSEKYFMAFP